MHHAPCTTPADAHLGCPPHIHAPTGSFQPDAHLPALPSPCIQGRAGMRHWKHPNLMPTCPAIALGPRERGKWAVWGASQPPTQPHAHLPAISILSTDEQLPTWRPPDCHLFEPKEAWHVGRFPLHAPPPRTPLWTLTRMHATRVLQAPSPHRGAAGAPSGTCARQRRPLPAAAAAAGGAAGGHGGRQWVDSR